MSAGKLSGPMQAMLIDVQNGLGTHGSAFHRGEHVGRYSTARALRDRGLLDTSNELTALGQAFVDEISKEPSHGE